MKITYKFQILDNSIESYDIKNKSDGSIYYEKITYEKNKNIKNILTGISYIIKFGYILQDYTDEIIITDYMFDNDENVIILN